MFSLRQFSTRANSRSKCYWRGLHIPVKQTEPRFIDRGSRWLVTVSLNKRERAERHDPVTLFQPHRAPIFKKIIFTELAQAKLFVFICSLS